MENSCRKKYKPSPKKWILASKRTGFRRNSALIPANAGLFHYAGNNPVRYIDPDGRKLKRVGLTWGILNILLGKENVDRIWNSPMYDGFANISDRILYAAVKTPCTIIGQASDYVGLFALATGNVPLAALSETTGKVCDLVSFGLNILEAYNTGDWNEVYKQALAYGVSMFICFRIKGGIADTRVIQSKKNGGYYQKGHRGRLTNKSGMRKMFIQTMKPEIGKKASKELFNVIWDISQKQMKANNEE